MTKKDQVLGSTLPPDSESALREDDRTQRLFTQEQPHPSVGVITYNLEAFEFYCHMNRSDPSRPYPVLEVGSRLSIQPSLMQLAQLRDEITAFLEEGATNTRTSPQSPADSPNSNKKIPLGRIL